MSHGYHVSIDPHAWPDAIRERDETPGAWDTRTETLS